MSAILFSVIAFFSTILGGFLAIKYHEKLHYIISFSAGVLIAVCFFEILPEIFSITTEKNLEIIYPLIAVVAGFLTIHILEKLAVIHSAHEEEYAEHRHPIVGLVGAGGLAFHSFLDGLGIGLAFQVSPQIGLVVSVAIIAHDFCDGLNTVTVMLINKHTRSKAIALLVVDAIAPILGVISTLLFTIPDNFLVLYLGFFVGFLLYLGASDLLPEAHSKHSSWGMLALTVLGTVFIFLVTRFV